MQRRMVRFTSPSRTPRARIKRGIPESRVNRQRNGGLGGISRYNAFITVDLREMFSSSVLISFDVN